MKELRDIESSRSGSLWQNSHHALN